MRQLVQRAGLHQFFHVDSAGMQDYHTGEAPDRRSAAVAAKHGFPLDGQVARQVRRQDFEAFDWLLALDKGHLSQLQRLAPEGHAHKAVLFLAHAGITHTQEVPDPYYGSECDFEQVLELIVEGCEALLAKLCEA